MKIADRWLLNPKGTPLSEVPTGTVNGVNKDFVVSQTPLTATMEVYLDGLLETEYTFNPGTKTITMTTAPVVGQGLRAIYNY